MNTALPQKLLDTKLAELAGAKGSLQNELDAATNAADLPKMQDLSKQIADIEQMQAHSVEARKRIVAKAAAEARQDEIAAARSSIAGFAKLGPDAIKLGEEFDAAFPALAALFERLVALTDQIKGGVFDAAYKLDPTAESSQRGAIGEVHFNIQDLLATRVRLSSAPNYAPLFNGIIGLDQPKVLFGPTVEQKLEVLFRLAHALKPADVKAA